MAREFGFFCLSGHGIAEGLTRSVVGLARRFFSLPDGDKLAIEMASSPHFRGYARPGFEYTRGQKDWREQVDIGVECPASPQDASAPAWTRLLGPTSGRPSVLPLRALISRRHDERAAITLTSDDKLQVAYQRMKLYDVSQLPALMDDGAVGIIDESDPLLAVFANSERFHIEVRSAMSSAIETLPAGAPVTDHLLVFDYGHVAVVVEYERFLGLVTRIDLLNHPRRQVD